MPALLNKETDTICAISSPSGEGAISVIRLSGHESIPIFKKIFRPSICINPSDDFNPKHFYVGKIFNPFIGSVIDEIGAIFMAAPKSYTGEDMVELYPHGGIFNTRYILEIILKMGARLAYNGEFTKRAYLNGKISLIKAEGILEIIKATSVKSLLIANNELNGLLEARIKAIKENFLYILAGVEALIDFPEEEFKEMDEKFFKKSGELLNIINSLIDSYGSYMLNKQGLSVVIAGKPNAGKSSLLNALLQKTRAIVSDIPGTTRDYIEENLFLFNKPVKIIDTAGLRESKDKIESEGVKFSFSLIENADIILYVIDSGNEISKNELKFIKKHVKNIIPIINKIDKYNKFELKTKTSQFLDIFKNIDYEIKPLFISVEKTIGIDLLKDAIYNIVIKLETSIKEDITITTLRQKNLLEKSLNSLMNAIENYKNRQPLEITSIELRDASKFIDELIGGVTNEDILDTLFKEFCIGK